MQWRLQGRLDTEDANDQSYVVKDYMDVPVSSDSEGTASKCMVVWNTINADTARAAPRANGLKLDLTERYACGRTARRTADREKPRDSVRTDAGRNNSSMVAGDSCVENNQ